MARRIIFGGPSEINPNAYPSHPRLVSDSHGEHSARNPGYVHSAGQGAGVTYGQQMPEAAQRGLTRNANADMQESKGAPGAMGSYWAPGTVRRDSGSVDDKSSDNNKRNDSRHGHQLFLGSSMNRRSKNPPEVVLEPDFRAQVERDDHTLPSHRRGYKCAEPGLISEHRYANKAEETGRQAGRFYIQGRAGGHYPPCGHGSDYGCRDICAVTGDRDLGA